MYDDESSWQSAAVAFLVEGAERGEQLLYVSNEPSAAHGTGLVALPGRDALLASGRLAMQCWPQAVSGGPNISNGVSAEVTQLIAAALQAGYPSLRVAVNASTLMGGLSAADPVGCCEVAFDVLAASNPLTVMCGYRSSSIPASSAARCTHPISNSGRDGACKLYLQDDRWQLTGEVDLAGINGLREVLAAIAAVSIVADMHVDCLGLRFIGVAGVEALVNQARALARPRRLLIHHPPHNLARTLAIGWGEYSGLEIVNE